MTWLRSRHFQNLVEARPRLNRAPSVLLRPDLPLLTSEWRPRTIKISILLGEPQRILAASRADFANPAVAGSRYVRKVTMS